MNIDIEQLEKERKELKAAEDDLIEEIYGHHEQYYDHNEEEEYYRAMNSPEFRLNEIGNRINILDEQIGSFKRTEFLKKHINQINKNSTKTLNKDYLNRTELAKVIADLINQQTEKDKLSIGLLGEWGSGKSTFLRMIQEQLKGDSNVIQFNASQYDDQEQIWYSLLHSISKKYLSNKKLKFKKIRLMYKKSKGLIWGSFTVPILFIAFTTFFFEYIKDIDGFLSLLGVSTTGVLSIITGFLSFEFLKRLYSNLMDHFTGNKEKFMEQLKYPDYKKYLGTREYVRGDIIIFKDLILQQTNSKNSNKNLVIIIDELDRCSDKTIINFFTSIEAFIDIPGITFLFSINPEVVYPVVAESIPYKQPDYTQSNLGATFIEKYINVFVTLPINSDYSSYVKEILTDIIDYEEIDKLIVLINGISYSMKISPREVKKLLDLIIIYKDDFIDLTFLEFSTLLIMRYYYKDFIDIFSNIKLSNVQFKNLSRLNFIGESKNKTDIPQNIIECMFVLLAESNMKSINRSMSKIDRILAFT